LPNQNTLVSGSQDFEANLVLAVNKVVHDLEGFSYHIKHEAMFALESPRWQAVTKRFIVDCLQRVVVLDIGSGTGFVPQIIAPQLKIGDLCICSDVSATMLQVCRDRLSETEVNCGLKFLLLDGERISQNSEYFTHVTMNSVLHHLANIDSLLIEVDRVLCPGGRVFIGHEPNAAFYRSRFLRWVTRIVRVFLDPLHAPKNICSFYKFRANNSKKTNRIEAESAFESAFVEEVNQSLLREGIIQKPLSKKEIGNIVDLRSAGGSGVTQGIDIEKEIMSKLNEYQVEFFQTYNHLGKVSNKNFVTRAIDHTLRLLFPHTGGTFFVVLRKSMANRG